MSHSISFITNGYYNETNLREVLNILVGHLLHHKCSMPSIINIPFFSLDIHLAGTKNFL